jgi:hypothetical protein
MPKGGSCQAAACPHGQNKKLKKKQIFVDIIISNVVCDLPFS